MTRLMTMAAIAAILAGAAVVPQASAVPSQHVTAAAKCTTKWKVTGKSVAVRRPAWNDTNVVAKPDSPVVRTLHRGDEVTSCTTMVARTSGGPAYKKCGKEGYLWRVVKGGQVPATCLRKA